MKLLNYNLNPVCLIGTEELDTITAIMFHLISFIQTYYTTI